jgi:NodT family efflux transporter outer membrane factor (OMF) lipoprotein
VTARRLRLAAALAFVASAACAKTNAEVAKVPEVKLPAAFDGKRGGRTAATMSWKEYFADENLNALVATALESNHDLRVALQRIEIARAGVRQATGALLPKVSVAAGAGASKLGTYTAEGAGNPTTHYGDFTLGLESTWEVDVWGKLRAMRDSARAQYLSTIEGTSLVVTSLVSDVAVAYFDLIALDHTAEVLARAEARQTEALEMMRLQKEAGRSNELAVQQFEAQLASTRAMAAAIGRRGRETENQVSLLIGQAPRTIVRSRDLLLREVADVASPGVPSDLLANRPDIREAELQVQASRFDVDAARAAFFPSLTLTAGVGYRAFDPKHLFVTPESLVYSVAGGITAPLLNRSGLEAQHDAAKAAQVQAMYAYQGVILKAFVEVASSLIAVEKASEVVAQKRREKAAMSGTVAAADALFRAGRATYLDVLLAQQKTLDAELELIDALRDRRIAGVRLYRAIGGGWHPLVAVDAPR